MLAQVRRAALRAHPQLVTEVEALRVRHRPADLVVLIGSRWAEAARGNTEAAVEVACFAAADPRLPGWLVDYAGSVLWLSALAGSDVAAMQATATRDGAGWRLDGTKTWISNGGIADFYVVFARTGEAPGAKGISAFLVDAQTPGLVIEERIDVVAPHPLATLRFEHCVVPDTQLLGQAGSGFKVAMATLDVFRTSVAAAALGFARRALHESIAWAKQRRLFGQHLADFQITQTRLAEMATLLDAAALLTYRAAWLRDQGQRITREAAMAKMTATENAQRIIDMAVQMHGGMGVRKGHIVESLYREIRALRIYEGATEVQQLIIGKDVLNA